ncbi:OmpA family protein [Parapedobacter sp. SGR-10]|uniref:OmpA family protein n=1 Tax=Parapedobacter sp. SGR-10 TaxID=2710879 RepID=UPI0013D6688F|nr:OmpA family protein [Parapedobacter sp. SGR-10]NGF58059.1 OmpA family protein [Parapedobacter sp. SGR-10]
MNKTLNYIISACLMSSFFLYGTANAQEQPSPGRRAESLYRSMEYARAAAAYEKLVDIKKPRTSDMERLAESYLYLNRYELAENWYARVVRQPDASREAYLNYAEALKQRGKYTAAKEQYQQYASRYGVSDTVTRAIRGVDSALVWVQNPTNHKLRNERGVNTERADFGYFPTGSGKGLYVTEPHRILGSESGMTGESYLRVYSVEHNADSTLANPNPIFNEPNDGKYHIGPVAVDQAGQKYYVTRTYPGKTDTERFRAFGQKWRRQNLELLIYSKEGDSWKVENFPYNNAKEYSLGHAALSEDGKTLYFASDMPGGKGGVDIWYSELQADGTWGAPQNAGDKINTNGDEMFPSLDNGTLYFSSNGHIGMGGLDIFSSKGSKGNWSTPKNLGYPLNSASDDFAYTVAHKGDNGSYTGYLSSNRVGGAGSDDIYSFTYNYIKPCPQIMVKTIVRDKNTGELLPLSDVTLFSETNQIISKGKTDEKAQISFTVDCNTSYRVLGEKEKYHDDSLPLAAVHPTRDTTLQVTLNLQPAYKVGDRFVLENIHYDFDKHNIRPDAAKILDELVQTMRKYPTLRIELSSHTDCRGSNKYNEDLSQRRAQAAVNYIVSQGIARNRLVARGYGENRLLNRCADGVPCSEAEHQANRRTEVEVLEF